MRAAENQKDRNEWVLPYKKATLTGFGFFPDRALELIRGFGLQLATWAGATNPPLRVRAAQKRANYCREVREGFGFALGEGGLGDTELHQRLRVRSQVKIELLNHEAIVRIKQVDGFEERSIGAKRYYIIPTSVATMDERVNDSSCAQAKHQRCV
jgi:hypothetical protein